MSVMYCVHAYRSIMALGNGCVLRCSVWEYRDGYRDQVCVMSVCIQNC